MSNTINRKTIRRFLASKEEAGAPVTGTNLDEVCWDIHERLMLHPVFFRKLREIVGQLEERAWITLTDSVIHVLTYEERAELNKANERAERREYRLARRQLVRKTADRARWQLHYSHQATLALMD